MFGTRRLGGADGVRGVTRAGADLIARTSMSAISNQARERVYTLNDDLVQWVIYRATLDSRTSPICRALDGRQYRVGKGPRPPQHPRCRSTSVPVIDGGPLGTRPAVPLLKSELDGLSREARRRRVRELVGPVPAETTYSQFLRRQSAAFQDEVLGRSSGEAVSVGESHFGAVCRFAIRDAAFSCGTESPLRFRRLIPRPATPCHTSTGHSSPDPARPQFPDRTKPDQTKPYQTIPSRARPQFPYRTQPFLAAPCQNPPRPAGPRPTRQDLAGPHHDSLASPHQT